MPLRCIGEFDLDRMRTEEGVREQTNRESLHYSRIVRGELLHKVCAGYIIIDIDQVSIMIMIIDTHKTHVHGLPTPTHACEHTRTHARTHTHTHTLMISLNLSPWKCHNTCNPNDGFDMD